MHICMHLQYEIARSDKLSRVCGMGQGQVWHLQDLVNPHGNPGGCAYTLKM